MQRINFQRSSSWDSNPSLPAAKGCSLNRYYTPPKDLGSLLGTCRGWVAGAFRGLLDTQTVLSKPVEAEFGSLKLRITGS